MKAQLGVSGQHQASAALTPGKGPSTHCTGDWVGPTAGLDGCEKSRLHGDPIRRTYYAVYESLRKVIP